VADIARRAYSGDFEKRRPHQAFDKWKHVMWDEGSKLPTQVADGRSICFCGVATRDRMYDLGIDRRQRLNGLRKGRLWVLNSQ
jgi:hypothetical protein